MVGVNSEVFHYLIKLITRRPGSVIACGRLIINEVFETRSFFNKQDQERYLLTV